MHTLQRSDPDRLEHNRKEVRGTREGETNRPKSCQGSTHHGRAGTEVQELGDEGVNVQTHDLGRFQ